MLTDKSCPCQSGRLFSLCCAPLLSGSKTADTAETLMRSRYCAYTMADVNYLLKTWHTTTRPTTIDPATIPDWQKLEVISTNKGGESDKTGFVEFKAYALVNNSLKVLHERSRFVKENNRWLYVEGIMKPETNSVKISRNDPCPCNSGKKYKKCCGP